MILSLKVLAAAGLAVSVATGGAIATHAPADHQPSAAAAAPGGEAGAVTGVTVADDEQGDDNEHGEDTTTTSTTGEKPAVTPSVPSVSVQAAGDAGTVTLSVSGGVITITDVHANAGWVAETEEAAGREVEVSFRNGLRRIDFSAEFEDGRMETRVRERTVERDDSPVATTPTTPTTLDDRNDDDDRITTPTTRDDDRIDREGDDHSGPGSGDDRSGSGGGDDDHSGSGRSGGGDDH